MKSLIKTAEEMELSEESGDIAFCLIDADVKPQKDRQIKQVDKLAKESKIASQTVVLEFCA